MTPSYRKGWPALNPLQGDPAMNSGSSDKDMLAFNKFLYTPKDTQPQAFSTPLPEQPQGWQTGNPIDIYRQYKTPGADTPAMYGGFPIGGPNTASASPTGPQPQAATGPTGDPGAYAEDWGGTPIPRMPSENAMQRHQAEAGAAQGGSNGDVRTVSPQRQYFWGTGRVDAHPTQNPNDTTERFLPATNWDETFGTNRQHMGAPGVTWAQRQATNQQKEADARDQRGLSPY